MTLSQWSQPRAHKDFEASLQTYQVGAHFEAPNETVLMAPSDSRYTQVGFNLFSVQVWDILTELKVDQDLQGQCRSHGQPGLGHPDHLEVPGQHF